MSFIIILKPISTREHNFIELFNKAVILCTSYFICAFTDWVPVVYRSKLGYFYMYLLIGFITINFVYIILCCVRSAYWNHIEKKHTKAWAKFELDNTPLVMLLLESEVNRRKNEGKNVNRKKIDAIVNGL